MLFAQHAGPPLSAPTLELDSLWQLPGAPVDLRARGRWSPGPAYAYVSAAAAAAQFDAGVAEVVIGARWQLPRSSLRVDAGATWPDPSTAAPLIRLGYLQHLELGPQR